MLFKKTPLPGAYIIELEPSIDDRGYFARTFCKEEFESNGLIGTFVQCNVSFNKKRGTLRGMHYQEEPFEEAKLVRCTRGAIFDVIIDIRKDSPYFTKWYSVELSQDNGKMLYIPKGFAHGFITLEDSTEVFYQMSEMYVFGTARGIRYDDESIGILWPEISDMVISQNDLSLGSLNHE